MSATLELQKLIYEALVQNTDLSTLLGGSHIYDAVPASAKPPYILFGEIESDDWSTGTEDGEELSVELVVWSSERGRKQAVQISEKAKQGLNGLPGTTANCRLVNFAWESTVTDRTKDNRFFIAKLRFRAVLEPLLQV